MDIITPISPEYKKLLRDSPELSDLKEFFSDYVSTILEKKEENNRFLTKEDFEIFEFYLESIKKFQRVNNKNSADINLSVKNINDNIEIYKSLLKRIKEKYWWLSDSFKWKKLKEKFTINTPFWKKEIYNFNNKLTKENLVDIEEVFNMFDSFENKEPLEDIEYIIFDNEEKENPNDLSKQNWEYNHIKKYVNILPNAFLQNNHRIWDFSNLKWTLIHEISHAFSMKTIDKFSSKFWNYIKKEWKNIQQMRVKNPEKCISEYAKINPNEDLSESIVWYLMDQVKLDINRKDFIDTYIAWKNIKNSWITIEKEEKLYLPKIEDITYFVEKKKRKKFIISES